MNHKQLYGFYWNKAWLRIMATHVDSHGGQFRHSTKTTAGKTYAAIERWVRILYNNASFIVLTELNYMLQYYRNLSFNCNVHALCRLLYYGCYRISDG